MPTGRSCPDLQVLEELAVGRMAPEEVDRWAEHCEQCEECLETIRALKTEDTLAEAMAAQATARNEAPSPAVGRLIERLKATLRPIARSDMGSAVDSTSGGSPSSDAPPAAAPAHASDTPEEGYDFLAPA